MYKANKRINKAAIEKHLKALGQTKTWLAKELEYSDSQLFKILTGEQQLLKRHEEALNKALGSGDWYETNELKKKERNPFEKAIFFKDSKKIELMIKEKRLSQEAFAEKVGVSLKSFRKHLEGKKIIRREYIKYILYFFILEGGLGFDDLFKHEKR